MPDFLRHFYISICLIILFCPIVGYCSNTDSYPQVYPAPSPPTTIIEVPTPNMPIYSIPNETVPEPSPVSSTQQKQEVAIPVQENVAQSGGSSNTAAFFSYDQNPSNIEIEESTDPNDEDYYMERYPINVNVDVQSRSSYPLSDVIIKDETDPDLIINNKSRYCIIDPFEGSIGNNEFPCGDYPKQIGNNILKRSIDRLDPKKWIRYSYTIFPTKNGTYHIRTIARISGNNSNIKDVYYSKSLKIKSENIKFEITPLIDSYIIKTGENKSVIYDIKYEGNNPYLRYFSIKLKANDSDYHLHYSPKSLGFSTKEWHNQFSFYITFNNTNGNNRFLPDIYINGLESSINSQEITVIAPFISTLRTDILYSNGKDVLILIIQFLSVIIAIYIAIIHNVRENRKLVNGIKEELHNILEEFRDFRRPTKEKPYSPPWWQKPPSNP